MESSASHIINLFMLEHSEHWPVMQSDLSLVTQTGYYHGSTVGPVVGPVFCPFVFVGCLRNFLYELKGDQSWYEKPESGRVRGPKGDVQALLGRP